MSFAGSEPPTSSPRYSDNELLEILREKVKENPDVTADEFNSMDDTPAMITYIRRFGSWNKAREKADLDIICKGRQETVVDEFKHYEKRGGAPSSCPRVCRVISYSVNYRMNNIEGLQNFPIFLFYLVTY